VRFPCYTTRTPGLPHLILIAPPGPAPIFRVPQSPLRVYWCHMFSNIPDSATMSSIPSVPFVAWTFYFSSSDSHSLVHDPNISSLNETKFMSFLPRRFRGGDLILGSSVSSPCFPIVCFKIPPNVPAQDKMGLITCCLKVHHPMLLCFKLCSIHSSILAVHFFLSGVC
jgi:hypothetical protein